MKVNPNAALLATSSMLVNVHKLITALKRNDQEDIYKIYAESILSSEHLHRIIEEAQSIIDDVFANNQLAENQMIL